MLNFPLFFFIFMLAFGHFGTGGATGGCFGVKRFFRKKCNFQHDQQMPSSTNDFEATSSSSSTPPAGNQRREASGSFLQNVVRSWHPSSHDKHEENSGVGRQQQNRNGSANANNATLPQHSLVGSANANWAIRHSTGTGNADNFAQQPFVGNVNAMSSDSNQNANLQRRSSQNGNDLEPPRSRSTDFENSNNTDILSSISNENANLPISNHYANLRHANRSANLEHSNHWDNGRRPNSQQMSSNEQRHHHSNRTNNHQNSHFGDENQNPHLNNDERQISTATATTTTNGRHRDIGSVERDSILRPLNADDVNRRLQHQPQQPSRNSTNHLTTTANNNNNGDHIVEQYLLNGMDYLVSAYSGLDEPSLQLVAAAELRRRNAAAAAAAARPTRTVTNDAGQSEQQQHQQLSSATAADDPRNQTRIDVPHTDECCDSETNNDETTNCTICLEHINPSAIEHLNPSSTLKELTSCQHIFHRECIDTWLVNVQACPLCRAEVDIRDLIGVRIPPRVPTGDFVLDVSGREVRGNRRRVVFTGSMTVLGLSPGESISISDNNEFIVLIMRGFNGMRPQGYIGPMH